jgi:hypothetical protein
VAPELKRKAEDLLSAGVFPKKVKQSFLDDPTVPKTRVPTTEQLRSIKQCMNQKDRVILGNSTNRELLVHFNKFKVC